MTRARLVVLLAGAVVLLVVFTVAVALAPAHAAPLPVTTLGGYR